MTAMARTALSFRIGLFFVAQMNDRIGRRKRDCRASVARMEG